MPIVSPNKKMVRTNTTLPKELVDELSQYAKWAGSSVSHTLATAIQRLFWQDTDWVSHKANVKPKGE